MTPARFRELDAEKIGSTLRRLRDRVGERFPESGLHHVSAELVTLAGEVVRRVEYLRRPLWAVRVGVGLTIVVMCVILALAVLGVRLPGQVNRFSELVQLLESAVNDLVFLGVAVYFLLSVESRIKRRRVLESLHELRSVVHIIDMHQLTKDPERLLTPRADTAASPVRTMSGPELGRYLDYCSELLSLTSKLAALFVQHFKDPVVLAAVNEIETLVTGLSGKIWQKIGMLDRVTGRER
jgi:hypothetical protein